VVKRLADNNLQVVRMAVRSHELLRSVIMRLHNKRFSEPTNVIVLINSINGLIVAVERLRVYCEVRTEFKQHLD
jgi:hypothetical protein